jgi:hypothetical protein
MNPTLAFDLSAVYGGGALAPAHRADLEKSGISETLRVEQGIRSVPPNDFARLLGRDVPAAVTSILLFPYPDPAGGWMGHFQAKLFPPPPDTADRGPKYLQRSGAGSRVYFVRRALADVLAPARELWICEGAKKALRAAELGLATIGIQGVDNWHARGMRRLLSDFDAVPLQGRAVRFIPDGDLRANPHVERAAADFAVALEARGAIARIVLLPLGTKLDELAA